MNNKGAAGITLIAVGMTQLVGAITGNGAAMLAALFEPAMLETSTGGNSAIPHHGNIVSGILGSIGPAIRNSIPGIGPFLP